MRRKRAAIGHLARRMPALLMAAFVATACGISLTNESLAPDDLNPDHFMTAVVEGTSFMARDLKASFMNSTLTLSGVDASQRRIVFNVYCERQAVVSTLPRTFLLTAGSVDSVGFAQYSEPLGVYFSFYTTASIGARGNLTVTALTSEEITGTFWFVASASGGTGTRPGTRDISSGQFSVKF
jgi:hypothetical protein